MMTGVGVRWRQRLRSPRICCLRSPPQLPHVDSAVDTIVVPAHLKSEQMKVVVY